VLRVSERPGPAHGRAADDEALQVARATYRQPGHGATDPPAPQQYLWGYNRYKQPRRRAPEPPAKRPRHDGHAGGPGAAGVLWLLQHLPLAVQAALGRGLGAVLHRLAGSRRRIALRNVALCLPELDAGARRRLVREHFGWLGRSLLERGLLWYARAERLKRLIHVEGDVGLAERSDRPVMWLVPHFLALDVAGAGILLFQTRQVASIYQAQSNPVFDRAMRRGGCALAMRRCFAPRDGAAAGARHQAAACLLQPARHGLRPEGRGLRALLRRAGGHAAGAGAHGAHAGHGGAAGGGRILPGGQGWRVRFLPPMDRLPHRRRRLADTSAMNRWIEQRSAAQSGQYLWVHKRFKTRPPGEQPRCTDPGAG
jgi:KDO2-lipid IV(A) lauroyltransferase